MTSRDFCYWLQGYFEIEKTRTSTLGALGEDQVKCIADHLALVYVHEIDPSFGGSLEQAKLDAVHAGVSKEELAAAIEEAIRKIPKPPQHRDTGSLVMKC